jgi:GTP diphosphokinase / guanosine-3',5'-bis(diphosphate) 3'-diphosphatase
METGSSPVRLKRLIENNTNELAGITERLVHWFQAGYPEESEIWFGIAEIAMLEAGVTGWGAIAFLVHHLPDETIFSLGLKEQQFFRRICGIRAIESLNTSRANFHSENFMKLLLLLAGDMQALLAVLGYRIYQLRHFQNLTEDQRKRLISDIEHLYLPLTHRLGLYRIKSEMEDFVMQNRYPDIFHKISIDLAETAESRNRYIESFIHPIRRLLEEKGVDADIRFRVKTVSSIWRKMKTQQVGLTDVLDVFAVRIIDQGECMDEKRRCWEIYSLVTDLYPPDPDRLRDWISVPRPSGYESLHTTVLGPGNRWVEVQIRTNRMDLLAEEGPAAHWRYKEGKQKSNDEWLVRARLLLEPETKGNTSASSANITSEIFTLTPEGDLVKLSPGATVLDFAFQVHSEVGLRCKGAVVNGKIMPIRHVLSNGDRVEILTSRSPNVSEDWMKIVVSSKARNRIRKALQEKDDKDSVLGKEMLERKLKQWKAGSLDENLPVLMQHFRVKDVAVFYALVINEKISTTQIREVLEKLTEKIPEPDRSILQTDLAASRMSHTGDEMLLINDEIKTKDYQLAKCCHPVFGDDIFGFVTVGKGIRIHRNDCPNALEMKTRYPYRIIPSRWSTTSENSGFHVTLAISGHDRLGIIHDITDVVSKDMKVMTRSATFDAEDGKFKGLLRLFVKDAAHIGWIIRKIRRINGVEKVVRQQD